MCEIHLNENRTPGLPADLLVIQIIGFRYGAMVISDPATRDSNNVSLMNTRVMDFNKRNERKLL